MAYASAHAQWDGEVRSAIRDEFRSRLRLVHRVRRGAAANGGQLLVACRGNLWEAAIRCWCVVAATANPASLLINGARC